jgi:hypothetical protein
MINYSPDGWGVGARGDTPSGSGLTPNPEVCSAERGTFLGRPMLATFRVGGWMESRAAHYRRLAEECLALSRLDGFTVPPISSRFCTVLGRIPAPIPIRGHPIASPSGRWLRASIRYALRKLITYPSSIWASTMSRLQAPFPAQSPVLACQA